MIGQIDIAAVLGSWTGPRRIISAADMQPARPAKRARRLPASLRDRLVDLLSERRTVAQLVAATGEHKERVRHALRGLKADGRAIRTGERGPGKGGPEYWVRA
jgi:hypothetical protein